MSHVDYINLTQTLRQIKWHIHMNKTSITPEDILADKQNFIEINGIVARKGSVAAFLKNIDLLEDTYSSAQQKAEAQAMLEELAPAIIALKLYQHASFKNPIVQAILEKHANS